MQPQPILNSSSFLTKGNEIIKRKNRVYIFLLFLISPFLSLLLAIYNYRAEWAKNVVWFFVAFYGYSLVISNETMDANSYRDKFFQISESEFSFDNFAATLYNEETQYVDVLQPVITYGVALFTSNYKILFLVFALIFGYFYSRNIWYLLENIEGKLKKENIIWIFTFAIIVGFWQINGFRMWTAAHIYFYGAIRYLNENKKSGLVLALSSILMHFSFVLPVLVLFAYAVIGNRIHLYFWFLIATFFITEINFASLNQFLKSILPDIFSNKVDAYTHRGGEIENQRSISNLNWYAIYYVKILRWILISIMSIIYFKGLKLLKEKIALYTLYNFVILFLAVSNIMTLIPSGGRFFTVAALFSTTMIVFYFEKFKSNAFLKRFSSASKVGVLLYCVVAFRIGLDTIGIMAIFGNFFTETFMNIDIALIDVLK